MAEDRLTNRGRVRQLRRYQLPTESPSGSRHPGDCGQQRFGQADFLSDFFLLIDRAFCVSHVREPVTVWTTVRSAQRAGRRSHGATFSKAAVPDTTELTPITENNDGNNIIGPLQR